MKLCLAFLLGVVSPAAAQLTGARDGPVVYGHIHLTSVSNEAQMKFWVDTLGGIPIIPGAGTPAPAWTPGSAVGTQFIKFRDVFVTLNAQKAIPTAGTKGSTVDHVAFQVRDLPAIVARLKSAGYPVLTQAGRPDSRTFDGELQMNPDFGARVASVMGPDDITVEFVEQKTAEFPLSFHHVDLASRDPAAMSAWYAKTFGATLAKRGSLQTAGLPSVNTALVFARAAEERAPTRGRALDHIGFEVKDLEAFTRGLAAAGVKLDVPYTFIPALKVGFAYLYDPWGTYIELIEGFDRVP